MIERHTNEEIISIRNQSSIGSDFWDFVDTTLEDSFAGRFSVLSDIVDLELTEPVDLDTVISNVNIYPEEARQDMHVHENRDITEFMVQSFPVTIYEVIAEDLYPYTIKNAIDKCMKQLECSVFHGIPDINIGGVRSYGFTSTAHRRIVRISDWYQTEENIISDFGALLAQQYEQGFNGPFYLYVPNNIYTRLQKDYDKKRGLTYIKRITSYGGVKAVRPTPYLYNNNVVLVNMSRETIDMAIARDFTAVPIDNDTKVFIYGRVGHRLKTGYNGEMGIVIGDPMAW